MVSHSGDGDVDIAIGASDGGKKAGRSHGGLSHVCQSSLPDALCRGMSSTGMQQSVVDNAFSSGIYMLPCPKKEKLKME